MRESTLLTNFSNVKKTPQSILNEIQLLVNIGIKNLNVDLFLFFLTTSLLKLLFKHYVWKFTLEKKTFLCNLFEANKTVVFNNWNKDNFAFQQSKLLLSWVVKLWIKNLFHKEFHCLFFHLFFYFLGNAALFFFRVKHSINVFSWNTDMKILIIK